MTMKVIKLQLHCGADDALTVIEILDQLRNALADTYHDEISETMQADHQTDPNQRELPFDDLIPF